MMRPRVVALGSTVALLAGAVGTGCNDLFGVEDLAYDRPAAGAGPTGGGGAGGAGAGQGGAGGASCSAEDAEGDGVSACPCVPCDQRHLC
jgi:hypothetical protein